MKSTEGLIPFLVGLSLEVSLTVEPEPETLLLKELAADIQFEGFLSVHSGIQEVYIPFAGNSIGYFREALTIVRYRVTSAWQTPVI